MNLVILKLLRARKLMDNNKNDIYKGISVSRTFSNQLYVKREAVGMMKVNRVGNKCIYCIHNLTACFIYVISLEYSIGLPFE